MEDPIYIKYLDGMPTTALAKEYGVSRQAIIQRIDRIRREKSKKLWRAHLCSKFTNYNPSNHVNSNNE